MPCHCSRSICSLSKQKTSKSIAVKLEWDTKKAISNMQKHSISFEEAGTVFGYPMALTFDDPDHSTGEMRFLTFGLTRTNKFVIVSYTERQGVTRIISARKMSKQERDIYEKD